MLWKGRISQTADAVKRTVSGLRTVSMSRFFGEFFNARNAHPPGVDSAPPLNAQPLIDFISAKKDVTTGMPVTGLYLDEIPKLAESGELRLYATADGKIAIGYLWLKRDGTLELNGVDKGGLVEIYNLTEKINLLVAEIQSHTHPASGVPPSQTFTVFMAEDYENEKVKH